MPKLWTATIDDHHAAVRDAILDAAARMVATRGLTGVSMSGVAQGAGIGRATLYKYFPDVEAVLGAWHARQIAGHMVQLERSLTGAANPLEALRSVLQHMAQARHGHGGAEIALHLHRMGHVHQAHQHLRQRIAGLARDAALAGLVRQDCASELIADLCLSALTATEGRTAEDAQRAVDIVLDGLRPGAL